MSIYQFMPTINAILEQIPRNTGVADSSLSFNKTGDGMLFATYATLDGNAYFIQMNYRMHQDEEFGDDESDKPTDIYGTLEMEFYPAGHKTLILHRDKLTVTEKYQGAVKRPVTRGKWIHEQMKLACITATNAFDRNERMKQILSNNSK